MQDDPAGRRSRVPRSLARRIGSAGVVVLVFAAPCAGALHAAQRAAADPIAQAVAARFGTERFRLVRFDAQAAAQLRDASAAGFAAPLDVALDVAGEPAALVLAPFTVRAPHGRLRERRADGSVAPLPQTASRTFRGSFLWRRGGVVVEHRIAGGFVVDAAAGEGAALRALLLADDGSLLALQPLSDAFAGAVSGTHVLFDARDVDVDLPGCAADAVPWLWSGAAPNDPPHDAHPTGVLAAQGLKVAQLAIEADTFLVDHHGSVPATQADVEALVNAISLLYEADVGIRLQLAALIVQTGANDDYTTTKPQKLLMQFREVWNQFHGDVKRDTVHLLTARDVDGNVAGLAFVGVVCEKDLAYGFAYTTVLPSFPVRVALSAHEIGHNFGASHCDGTGDCMVMCSVIGQCSGSFDAFGPVASDEIRGFAKGIGCLTKLPPILTVPFLDTFAKALDKKRWEPGTGAKTNGKALAEPSGKRAVNLDGKGGPEGGADRLVSRTFDLSGRSGVTLSFFAQHRGVEEGETLAVEFLDAAQTWQPLLEVTSDGADQATFTPHEAELPPFALHDEFHLRFVAEVDQGNDDWFVDDVQLVETLAATAARLESVGAARVFEVHVAGGPAPTATVLSVANGGDAMQALGWAATKVDPAPWLDVSPGSGTVAAGEEKDDVLATVDPTGLAPGIYRTAVTLANAGDAADFVLVPVVLVVAEDPFIVPGATVAGSLDAPRESEVLAFLGVEGMQLAVTRLLAPELPVAAPVAQVDVLDEADAVVATWTFDATAKPKTKKVSLPASGLFRLRVSSADGSTGLFTLATGVVMPKSGRSVSTKVAPEVAGGTADLVVASAGDTVLGVTVVPKADGGPYTVTLLEGADDLHAAPFATPLASGGAVVNGFPLPAPGLYTLRIAGFVGTEKVTVHVAPVHPEPVTPEQKFP